MTVMLTMIDIIIESRHKMESREKQTDVLFKGEIQARKMNTQSELIFNETHQWRNTSNQPMQVLY